MKHYLLSTGRSWLVLATVMLILAGCGAAQSSTPVTATPAVAATSEPDRLPTEAPAGSAGLDQSKLDICAILPHDAVESAIGALVEEPQPSLAIGDEVGCEYVVDQGRGYSIIVYNLDRWDLIPSIIAEATPLAGLGDGAYSAKEVGGGTALYVLLQNRAVVAARVNGADTPQFRKLLDLALRVVAQQTI